MTANDAIDLYKLFDQHGIKVWIDGGWGVDALLGRQTRKHNDLDVALHHSNLPALCQLLEDRGYRHVPSGGSWACNFVLGDNQGHRIDLHSFELDTTVLFSKLKAPMRGLGLAPVAVHPSFQKQGVGLALIREGLPEQGKMDGCAYSCSAIPLTMVASDFASKAPKVIVALIPGIILWPCHSAMFPKPA